MTDNPITAWSFSRLTLYEECPAKFKYRHIDKLPEPQAAPLLRGQEIHKKAELFLKGEEMVVDPQLMRFGAMLTELRQYKPMVEQQWAFTRSWKPTGWFAKNCWLRVIPDAAVLYEDDGALLVIDHKTGKKWGDNADQMELFALAGFSMFPMVYEVETRLWYIDQGEEDVEVFEKKGLAEAREEWEDRVEPMFNDTTFLPRPNNKCKWCHFRRSNGGPCKYS